MKYCDIERELIIYYFRKMDDLQGVGAFCLANQNRERLEYLIFMFENGKNKYKLFYVCHFYKILDEDLFHGSYL